MLEHGLALVVGAHDEDIELVIFAVGAPVVLRGLQRRVHLVKPGADQGRILGVGGHNSAAAAVKAGGIGTVLGGEVEHVGLQHGHGLPCAGVRDNVGHADFNDVGNVPAEADAVAPGLALGNVGGPLLGESVGVDQILGVEFVEPFHALAPALGGGGAENLLVVADDDMAAGIGIAVAFAEAVAEDGAVLVAAADDAGHGDDVAVNAELGLDLVGVIAEGDQHLFKLVGGSGHL